MVERTNPIKVDLGSLEYELTDGNQVAVQIRLQQNSQLFKDQRAKVQKHLCLIIDDSGSMQGSKIRQVREHCAKFGGKFFDENGKKLTLIKFGSRAKSYTFETESDFQKKLPTL